MFVASQKGKREGRVNACSPRHPNPVIRATFSHSPVTYQQPTEFTRNRPRIVNVIQRETVRTVFYPQETAIYLQSMEAPVVPGSSKHLFVPGI